MYPAHFFVKIKSRMALSDKEHWNFAHMLGWGAMAMGRTLDVARCDLKSIAETGFSTFLVCGRG